MKLDTIKNKLCCPFDKSDLELHIVQQDINDNIQSGLLTCSSCKRIYPIVRGIPIMSPDGYREFKYEKPLIESWASQKGLKIGETHFLE